MNISELCINRPVFATVISLLLVLVGLVAADRLALREYPKVDKPVISIYTNYTGATAEVVESEISSPIEEIMSGLEGIDYMNSTSKAGTSYINITFKQSRDLEAAASDVRDRLDRVVYNLPKDISPPTIWKQDADLQPFMWLTVSSGKRNIMELTELAENQVKDRLLIVEGVGEVQVWAGREYAMRIWVDRAALASYALTVQDIEDALRRQNVDIPSGQVESDNVEINILAKTSLREPEQFENIVLTQVNGYLVRLRDVAKVRLGASELRNAAEVNGEDNLALGIRLQSTANPLEVARLIKAELAELEKILPDDVHVFIVSDTTVPIERSIDNVYRAFAEAIILVVLVIFFFLRSPRATLIPAVTIPISLIGVCALMWWWGFSVNTLTLLALVLGIGIVVDDAIVVLENIHRHIEEGMTPKRASIQGSKEIIFAVIAMTLTLAAVFAPLGFSQGATGKLFVEFALTLAGAVIISGFVALTLTPMMCARLLKAHPDTSTLPPAKQKLQRWSDAIESGINKVNHGYLNKTRLFTTRPAMGLLVLLSVIALAAYLTLELPRELAPAEDTGRLFIVGIAPEGTNVAYGKKYTKKLSQQLLDLPEITRVFASYGSPTINQHRLAVEFTDWDERQKSQAELQKEIDALLRQAPGMIFFTMGDPPLGQHARNRPVDLLLQSSLPYDELARVANEVAKKLRNNPALVGANVDLTLNKPQLEVVLDRDKLADSGIDVNTVGRTLETLFGGREVTQFQRGIKKYDVLVRLAPSDRSEPSDVRDVYLRNRSNELVLLEDLIHLTETAVPPQLNHFNKLRVANLTASPAPGYTLGETLDSVIADIDAMNLDTVQLSFGGQSREYLESNQQIIFIALMSLAFIYLVLAAQFESFRDPLIILLSVPFAILGASLMLNLTGKSFSIFTQIGMITLVGLIAKHGIMLVDTANRLRTEGMGKFDAIMTAAEQRFRPILMTTAAMVLGSVPLALATGAGSQSLSQIGWVIVGGLTAGTILTLLITPAIYMLLSRNTLEH